MKEQTYPNGKHRVIGKKTLPTKVKACTNMCLPRTVQTLREQQVVAVLGNSGPYTGVSPLSLQPLAILALGALKAGEEGNRLESRRVLVGTDIGAIFYSDMPYGGDGLPGGKERQVDPAGERYG